MVYVLDKEGNPLMPTSHYGKVRRMLNTGKALVLKTKPFTIQLQYVTTKYIQAITLGIDSGYLNIGFSAVSDKKELVSGECKLLSGMSERITERQKYRNQRRNRLRYRAKRFHNRSRKEGWLAPSIQHKLDSHVRLIDKFKAILPISKIIVEVANFDIQAIKDPAIEGIGYQQGEQYGFWNLREYILHRDGHQCQNPNCKNKSKNPVLQVHHIGFWKDDRTDRPGNLLTLCDKCHIPKNHKEKGFLYGWEPKIKSFKPETFMTMVRWKLINILGAEHTYGFQTKSKRIELKDSKSHANDAFVIANGTNQIRSKQLLIEQVRRNNRSLEKFYDAKYIDIRTGQVAAAAELHCSRRVRNRNKNGENLRIYRGPKISKGRVSKRTGKSQFQPQDEVKYQNKIYSIKGSHNKGARVILSTGKSVSVKDIVFVRQNKGFVFKNIS